MLRQLLRHEWLRASLVGGACPLHVPAFTIDAQRGAHKRYSKWGFAREPSYGPLLRALSPQLGWLAQRGVPPISKIKPGRRDRVGWCHRPKCSLQVMTHPKGPSFDREGNLFFVNWLSSSILKVTPEGDVTELYNTGGVPAGLAFHPDGSLYVADEGDDIYGIMKITSRWGGVDSGQ